MAARNMISPAQEQRVRDAIRSTCLVKRLQMFSLSEPDPQTSQPVQMTGDQVRAALGLLKKTVPDLATTEIKGDKENPITLITRRIVDPAKREDV